MLLNKHLTYENRKLIENSLNNNLNFSKIGLLINKPYKTISNEIKRNKIAEYGGAIAWYSQSPCKKLTNHHMYVMVVLKDVDAEKRNIIISLKMHSQLSK